MSTATSGTIDISRHYDPETDPACEAPWITIDHADSRILVSHELLEMIDRGECEPHARLVKTCCCSPGWCGPHYQGARLEVTASNVRLVYVIGPPLPVPDLPHPLCWTAEWPD